MCRAFAEFPTGVTVVTVAGADGPHGCTVSAFTPASVDPPLVIVCLMEGGSMVERVSSSDAFAVNVLAENQWRIGRFFANRARTRGRAGFERVRWRASPLGAPLLDGAVAQFDCTLHSLLDVGDHRVVIGAVGSVRLSAGDPLVYCRGRAARLAQPGEPAHG